MQLPSIGYLIKYTNDCDIVTKQSEVVDDTRK